MDIPTLSNSVAIRATRRRVLLLGIGVILFGLVAPILAPTAGGAPGDNSPVRTSTPNSGESQPASASPTDGQHPTSEGNATTIDTAATYAGCSGAGPIRGAICNTIENAKRSILEGTLDATQQLARSTLELIIRRPVPKRSSEIVVFRPPTNEPLAGAYSGWAAVGLPLGFLVWVVGAGVALASRFRPEAAFATQGFQIEQRLVRNLVLTLGSWWLGAFILHLANGLILAVAPQGDHLMMGPQSGVGTILGTGLLAGLLWVATAAIVTILLVATLLAYFLCLTFMVFLPVFSALMLFDTGGVLQTVGQFGQTGWAIFIKAVFFPLPAALVLSAGTYVAGGTMGFVEQAVAVGGFAEIASTLAFAAVMFVTQLAALVATLWMLMGSRATSTAGSLMAGVGGAAMYARAKQGVNRLADRASMPGAATSGGATAVGASGPTAGAVGGSSVAMDSEQMDVGPMGHSQHAPNGIAGADTAAQPSSTSTPSGAVSMSGVSLGGTPTSVARTGDGPSHGRSSTTSGAATDGREQDGPIVVEEKGDLPGNQTYQAGYVSDGEFQPAESTGQERELLVREHDRFVDAYNDDGDHPGIYLRGMDDAQLYDAAPVAGEEWGVSPSEAVGRSRDDVFEARGEDGDGR